MINNMLGSLIRVKLNISEMLIDKLPDSIGPHIRELRSNILSSLNDEISDYLKKDKVDKCENGIKKVELE
jgi:hypothetical protein